MRGLSISTVLELRNKQLRSVDVVQILGTVDVCRGRGIYDRMPDNTDYTEPGIVNNLEAALRKRHGGTRP